MYSLVNTPFDSYHTQQINAKRDELMISIQRSKTIVCLYHFVFITS